jgi:hypothetical protein
VCAYVDEMKKIDASVSRIIVDIKRMAAVEGGPLHRADASRDANNQAAAKRLLDDAVTWCIERSYDRT